jgi:hypothetical protein
MEEEKREETTIFENFWRMSILLIFEKYPSLYINS